MIFVYDDSREVDDDVKSESKRESYIDVRDIR